MHNLYKITLENLREQAYYYNCQSKHNNDAKQDLLKMYNILLNVKIENPKIVSGFLQLHSFWYILILHNFENCLKESNYVLAIYELISVVSIENFYLDIGLYHNLMFLLKKYLR